MARCEEDDVERAVLEARAVQERWASTSLDRRAAIRLRFHDLVLARQDEVLDLIQPETGFVLEWWRQPQPDGEASVIRKPASRLLMHA